MNRHLLITRKLGMRPYVETWAAMRDFTNSREQDTPCELWLLEHPPVFTQGQAGRQEHVLDPGEIPVVETDRGGQVTYHGPGQLVAYLLLDLRRAGVGVRGLVDTMEQSVIDLLAARGITANSRKDAPGVYVADRKIASLGLRVRHRCSYHGLALNVSNDLSPFARINPCGFPGLAATRTVDLGVPDGVTDLGLEFGRRIAEKLNYDIVVASAKPPATSEAGQIPPQR